MASRQSSSCFRLSAYQKGVVHGCFRCYHVHLATSVSGRRGQPQRQRHLWQEHHGIWKSSSTFEDFVDIIPQHSAAGLEELQRYFYASSVVMSYAVDTHNHDHYIWDSWLIPLIPSDLTVTSVKWCFFFFKGPSFGYFGVSELCDDILTVIISKYMYNIYVCVYIYICIHI
jgi:hypothetical protein